MKLIITSAIIVCCLLLSGCGGGDRSPTQASSNSSSATRLAAPSVLNAAVLSNPKRHIAVSDTESIPVLSSTGTLTVNCSFANSDNLASAPRISVYSSNLQPLAENLAMTVSSSDKNQWSYTGQIVYSPETPVQGLKTVLVSWQDKSGFSQSKPVGIFHYGETSNTSVPTLLDTRGDNTAK